MWPLVLWPSTLRSTWSWRSSAICKLKKKLVRLRVSINFRFPYPQHTLAHGNSVGSGRIRFVYCGDGASVPWLEQHQGSKLLASEYASPGSGYGRCIHLSCYRSDLFTGCSTDHSLRRPWWSGMTRSRTIPPSVIFTESLVLSQLPPVHQRLLMLLSRCW